MPIDIVINAIRPISIINGISIIFRSSVSSY